MERPNLVVILTDDQGRWAMPHRMPELQMPNLQALLAESLELDEMYCASPVCSPARASILTGRMPSAHGIHDWLVGGRHPEAYPDNYLDGQPTTPEALSRAGYQCFMSGKWHVGESRQPAPGFDRWYAHRYGGGPYVDAPTWVDGEPAEEPKYFTHAVTDNAVSFVKERDPERPFYLQVNYTAPHTPWLEGHPAEYLELYEGCDFPSVPREPRHPWTDAREAEYGAAYRDPAPHLVGYCAALSGVDAGIGALRTVLADEGLTANTVIVYLSDNGFSCGHHGMWGKGNGTYPLNFWDRSVRVPALVHVPGGPVGVTDVLLSSASLHSTLCELAGTAAPPDRWQASESFAPLLRGEAYEGSDVVVVCSEYGGGRMITDGRWKYVARHDGPAELYDRVADPEERVNLVETDPDRADDLASRLDQWFVPRERADVSGYERGVHGFGQVHPVWRGRSDDDTYVRGDSDVDTDGIVRTI